jgi:hypothetical protein
VRSQIAAVVAVSLLATGCSGTQEEEPANAAVELSTTTEAQSAPLSVHETSTTTTRPPSPYAECADYRQAVQSAYDQTVGSRVDQLRNEMWSEYPSPNADGVYMSMEEARALGQYLHTMAWAKAIREAMETIGGLIPPVPVQAQHTDLVLALRFWWDAELNYAAVIFPAVLYGEVTGLDAPETRQNDVAALLDPAFLPAEAAAELAVLLCPDP